MKTKRWKNRPDGSTWGDWGEDDQLGRLNLIGPEQVLKGIAEVKEGRTFCLSLPLHLPGGNIISPVRFPPALRPVIRNSEKYYNYEWRKMSPDLLDIGSDDCVTLYNQYSTQWDSLAHRGSLFDADGDGVPEPLYYNGFRAGEDVCMDGDENTKANALGIENMAAHGVQGRGVLVDLFSHFGDDPERPIGYADLMEVMDEDGIVIETGDILCLWTGLDRLILAAEGQPDPALKDKCAVLDGRDEKLLTWIAESGVAAIASDNIAVEALGTKSVTGITTTSLPLHELCLFKLGVHLGELWMLCDLAAWLKENNRSRFLLTAPPLRLSGAVGSPSTPIATV